MSDMRTAKSYIGQINRWFLFLPIAIMVVNLNAVTAEAGTSTAAAPSWLEPRGLSIVELIGQVPESYLKGMIISSDDGTGLVVYESGSRVGNRVTVTTTIYPRLVRQPTDPSKRLTSFGCLAQMPHFDHMSTTVPASTLRVYDSKGLEVTSQVRNLFITRMGTLQPTAGSTQTQRYPVDVYGYGGRPMPMGQEGLNVPSNSGCRIWIDRTDLYPLKGVFSLVLDHSPETHVLGRQRATFQSYIGPGNIGIFGPLMNQMSAAYGWRDGRILLSAPAEANYFMLKFPAMPGDPYTDSHGGPPYLNASRPFAGTYRLARSLDLSADLTFSAAFPLDVAWRDADRASGSLFLPLMEKPLELATPEYILPTGITYNNCFVQGGCPASLLQQIYDAQMTLEIFYLKVVPPSSGGQWVPVRMAGPAWSPSTTATAGKSLESLDQPANTSGVDGSPPAQTQPQYDAFLPLIAAEPRKGKPDGCPCGLFDDKGRLLVLIPAEGGAQ